MSAGTPVGVASRQQVPSVAPAASPGRLRALWNGVSPVAGARGTVLFGAVGLATSVPFLLRLHRRFGTWQAPAAALGVFAVMFAASALLIGPAINGTGSTGPAPAPAVDHNSHHQ